MGARECMVDEVIIGCFVGGLISTFTVCLVKV